MCSKQLQQRQNTKHKRTTRLANRLERERVMEWNMQRHRCVLNNYNPNAMNFSFDNIPRLIQWNMHLQQLYSQGFHLDQRFNRAFSFGIQWQFFLAVVVWQVLAFGFFCLNMLWNAHIDDHHQDIITIEAECQLHSVDRRTFCILINLLRLQTFCKSRSQSVH